MGVSNSTFNTVMGDKLSRDDMDNPTLLTDYETTRYEYPLAQHPVVITLNSYEPSSNPTFILKKNFQLFLNESTFDEFEMNYDLFKSGSLLSGSKVINTPSTLIRFTQPSSYAQIANTFRASTSDTIISLDNQLQAGNTSSDYLQPSINLDFRVSNPLKLRSTTKNLLNNYNALQKVFHARLDEGRSNARLSDISNSYNRLPLLSESKSPYESLLGKNKESFFNLTSYTSSLTNTFADLNSINNTLGIYFSDIPF